MFVRFVCLSVLLMLSFNVRLSAEDTETRISKFAQDVASAWSQYPLEKDSTVRKQKIGDLTIAVTSEMNKMDVPDGITLQRAVDNYSSNLQKIRTYFKQEKMSGERTSYATLCGVAFRREAKGASDFADERTASKCYEMIVGWADSGRNALRSVPDDFHAAYYGALSEVFTVMVKTAKKDDGDPSQIYDKQLKEIARRFPAMGAFQKTNGPVASALETAAKAVNSRNKMP